MEKITKNFTAHQIASITAISEQKLIGMVNEDNDSFIDNVMPNVKAIRDLCHACIRTFLTKNSTGYMVNSIGTSYFNGFSGLINNPLKSLEADFTEKNKQAALEMKTGDGKHLYMVEKKLAYKNALDFLMAKVIAEIKDFIKCSAVTIEDMQGDYHGEYYKLNNDWLNGFDVSSIELDLSFKDYR